MFLWLINYGNISFSKENRGTFSGRNGPQISTTGEDAPGPGWVSVRPLLTVPRQAPPELSQVQEAVTQTDIPNPTASPQGAGGHCQGWDLVQEMDTFLLEEHMTLNPQLSRGLKIQISNLCSVGDSKSRLRECVFTGYSLIDFLIS